MKYEIRGKQVKVTDAIKVYIDEKLEKLNKYFNTPDEIVAHILIKVKGREQSIEVTIPSSNFTLRNEEKNQDLYTAIDIVVDKLERQIRKNKTRLGKINKEKIQDFFFEPNELEEQNEYKIVKRKKMEVKPMSEEEATLQMDMLNHDFFIYRDSKDMNVKIIYKRKDGNLGIIETV